MAYTLTPDFAAIIASADNPFQTPAQRHELANYLRPYWESPDFKCDVAITAGDDIPLTPALQGWQLKKFNASIYFVTPPAFAVALYVHTGNTLDANNNLVIAAGNGNISFRPAYFGEGVATPDCDMNPFRSDNTLVTSSLNYIWYNGKMPLQKYFQIWSVPVGEENLEVHTKIFGEYY